MPPTTRLQSRNESTPVSSKMSLNEGKTPSNKGVRPKRSFSLPKDLVKAASIAMVIAFTVMILATYLTFSGKLKLAGISKLSNESSYSSKLEFTIKYQVLAITFIIVALINVIHKRVTSPCVDPLSGYEYICQSAKNILTNSFETYFLTLVSQLTAISYLTADETMKVIPLSSFLFVIGRITFWLGYPMYRTGGFVTTFLPIIVLNGYNLYKFGSHMNLY